MHLIEPCCSQRQMKELRSVVEKNGTAEFEGYGDLSLTELLPAMMTRYDDVKLLIAASSLPDQASEIIARWMRIKWARMDGKGKVFAVRHLTLIADLSPEKSPKASQWLKDNPFGERLTLIDKEQEETVILLPDFAITGPVNLRYGHHFTAKAMGRPEDVAALWDKFLKPEEPEADQTTPGSKPCGAIRPPRPTGTPPTQEGKLTQKKTSRKKKKTEGKSDY